MAYDRSEACGVEESGKSQIGITHICYAGLFLTKLKKAGREKKKSKQTPWRTKVARAALRTVRCLILTCTQYCYYHFCMGYGINGRGLWGRAYIAQWSCNSTAIRHVFVGV